MENILPVLPDRFQLAVRIAQAMGLIDVIDGITDFEELEQATRAQAKLGFIPFCDKVGNDILLARGIPETDENLMIQIPVTNVGGWVTLDVHLKGKDKPAYTVSWEIIGGIFNVPPGMTWRDAPSNLSVEIKRMIWKVCRIPQLLEIQEKGMENGDIDSFRRFYSRLNDLFESRQDGKKKGRETD